MFPIQRLNYSSDWSMIHYLFFGLHYARCLEDSKKKKELTNKLILYITKVHYKFKFFYIWPSKNKNKILVFN